MLLRPDATFVDQVTNRAERVFPRGTEWLHFESVLPAKEVFENSVLDEAIGISGDLGVRAFAAADWQNWVSTTKIGLYEVGTRLGLPSLEGSPLHRGVANVYDSISASVSVLRQTDDPSELVPELLKNAGLQVVQQLSGQSNMVGQTVAQVLAAAVWAFDVVAAHKQKELAKHVALPPLQTEDPATDSWQVNRVFEAFRSKGVGGVVYPDKGLEPASNADYTGFFLPAYKHSKAWALQDRETGVAAQQGTPREIRGADRTASYNFDPGDGSTFGFMPGTSSCLRVLQASYRLYHTVRGTPVNRYTIRCRGVDKDCWKTVKAFDGSKDCRQCVDPESVWPVKGIGWGYGGAPINVTTPGENVGDFYPSLNKLLLNLLNQISRPGPLLYTIDVAEIEYQWRKTFEYFWSFAQEEWRRHPGSGRRGLISRLATLMTAFDDENGQPVPGGRHPAMPTSLIANPREDKFSIPFSASIFSRIIQPYCRGLARLQSHYLDTVQVAYIPPGAGALYRANGKLNKKPLSDKYIAAREHLLTANKRVLVDLRQVMDPEYRAALKAAGVKPSPVNPKLHGSPGIGDSTELLRPRPVKRPMGPPKPVMSATFVGSHELVKGATTKPPPRKVSIGVPLRSPTSDTNKTPEQGRNLVGVGAAVTAVVVTTAAVVALDQAATRDDS